MAVRGIKAFMGQNSRGGGWLLPREDKLLLCEALIFARTEEHAFTKPYLNLMT